MNGSIRVDGWPFPGEASSRFSGCFPIAWLEPDVVWVPTATDRHAEILRALLPHVSRPNLIHDAHLAALAISHGLILMSTDGDFARFPNLRWENPLR